MKYVQKKIAIISIMFLTTSVWELSIKFCPVNARSEEYSIRERRETMAGAYNPLSPVSAVHIWLDPVSSDISLLNNPNITTHCLLSGFLPVRAVVQAGY